MFKAVNEGDVTIVTLNVESLDTNNASKFKETVRPAIEGKQKIIFDVHKLEFVDSSGLGAILSSLRIASSNNGELVLVGMTKPVRVLFELVRMHRIVDVLNTKEEAVKFFKKDQR